jgi:hypothetical protein
MDRKISTQLRKVSLLCHMLSALMGKRAVTGEDRWVMRDDIGDNFPVLIRRAA